MLCLVPWTYWWKSKGRNVYFVWKNSSANTFKTYIYNRDLHLITNTIKLHAHLLERDSARTKLAGVQCTIKLCWCRTFYQKCSFPCHNVVFNNGYNMLLAEQKFSLITFWNSACKFQQSELVWARPPTVYRRVVGVSCDNLAL